MSLIDGVDVSADAVHVADQGAEHDSHNFLLAADVGGGQGKQEQGKGEILKEMYYKSGDFRVTHQAPANRWLLFSCIVYV